MVRPSERSERHDALRHLIQYSQYMPCTQLVLNGMLPHSSAMSLEHLSDDCHQLFHNNHQVGEILEALVPLDFAQYIAKFLGNVLLCLECTAPLYCYCCLRTHQLYERPFAGMNDKDSVYSVVPPLAPILVAANIQLIAQIKSPPIQAH